MNKIVLELQRDALDSAVSISDLLRKSLLVARKLGLSDFEAWVKKEMDGYGSEQPPDYRIARGEVRAWNPYHGWQPVIFQDPDQAGRLSRRAFGDSVAQLEDLIGREGDDRSGTFHIPLPQEMQRQLDEVVDFPIPTRYSLFAERTALVRALDSVRNVILNWAIELEQQEILGEGLSFTPQEKSHAAREVPRRGALPQRQQLLRHRPRLAVPAGECHRDPDYLQRPVDRLCPRRRQ